MAELAGWEIPIHFDERAACVWYLAFQQVKQLAQSRIGERARETPIADKSFDMQVFHAHQSRGRRDLCGELVQEIMAQTGNPVVQPCPVCLSSSASSSRPLSAGPVPYSTDAASSGDGAAVFGFRTAVHLRALRVG